MRIYAVTVTYGNRFHLLKQVIDSALEEGVSKVIVVDNNSEPESREKLKAYEKELGNNKIKVLYLDDNYGSAGGFKRGLEEAYNDPNCEFIWLLDDDNMPCKNSVIELKKWWRMLEHSHSKREVALLSYRPLKWDFEIRAILQGKPGKILGLRNSFLRFHFKDLFEKVKRFTGLEESNREKMKKKIISTKALVSVPVAPYGGLFFHKDLLECIGYPKEELFLYEDDTEWTYRISKFGGKIYLIQNSLVEDIDYSWNMSKGKPKPRFYFIGTGPKLRVYYGIRNRVFFEKENLVFNKVEYWFNVSLYLFLIGIVNPLRLPLVFKAINDGLKGNLGKIKKF